ncbi:gephyrin-like molybdotransferase Glp [Oleidesulfovibrio sp.]|uniref:molybdopterin molybdotransferase MoeA n=1 Tax=Oleidesulfovibrio sp. TaxID=2909707 RepID=UPI003A85E89E
MKTGFFNVLDVQTFIEKLRGFASMPVQGIALEEADGRVLAQDVLSGEDLPLAHRACMDGYAVRAADLFGASEGNPAYLEHIGVVDIERPADFVVEAGQCATIVTGGILPEGADAVIMVEHTQDMGAGTVEMRKSLAPHENVMLRGEDAAAGAVALTAGTVLRPQEIGLLAALGIQSVSVHRRPRVGIFSTGDEVIPVSETPRVGQVRDVNSYALTALVQRAGGVATCYGIVPDVQSALEKMLAKAVAENDVVLLSGGSSVGTRDLTMAALDSLDGATVINHGVAISPGKPLILASAKKAQGQCAVWGLPGQVTSAQVVMFVLGMPFLRWLSGEREPFDQRGWPSRRAVLVRNVASRQGREDYVRVRLQNAESGETEAVPVTGKSGLLRTMLLAQGVVRIPAASEGLDGGATVDVLLFGGSC